MHPGDADVRSETINGMESRKAKHIDVCLTEAVDYQTLTTGLERVALPYNALTRTNLGAIDLHTEFLGVRLEAPVLIGAMTGGAAPPGGSWKVLTSPALCALAGPASAREIAKASIVAGGNANLLASNLRANCPRAPIIVLASVCRLAAAAE